MQRRVIENRGCPESTPWGYAQTVDEIMPGQMWWVSTAGHGGVYVCPELYREMPEFIDWCLPVVVFAERLAALKPEFTRVDPTTGNPFYLDAFGCEYHNERRTQWEAR